MYKKRDARAKLLFCRSLPIGFFPFSLPSPSSLLKLPNMSLSGRFDQVSNACIALSWKLNLELSRNFMFATLFQRRFLQFTLNLKLVVKNQSKRLPVCKES